jgi:DNA-binding MarR family transcriptional regulator
MDRRAFRAYFRGQGSGGSEAEACKATTNGRHMSGRTSVASFADCVALLVKQPRTLVELAELTGYTAKTVHIWIHALQDEGLVKPERKRGSPEFIWTWAP